MPGGRGCTGEEVCGNIAWRHPGCLEEVVGVLHGEGTTLLSYSVLLCTLYSVLLSDVLWFSQVWWKQSNTESRNRCYRQCQDTALHRAVLYCTALYCTALYSTALYCTVLACTVLHCTVHNYINTSFWYPQQRKRQKHSIFGQYAFVVSKNQANILFFLPKAHLDNYNQIRNCKTNS